MTGISKISIALVLIVVLALSIGWFIHARSMSAYASCRTQLLQIDTAKQNWGLEHNKTTNDIPSWDDIHPYLPRGKVDHEIPVCPQNGTYTIGRIGEPPKCSIGGEGHSL